jgi:hypothetical protein
MDMDFATSCPLDRPVLPHIRFLFDTEIYRSAAGLQEEVQLAVSVAFGKGQVAEGEPIVETLKQYANLVERIISICERKNPLDWGKPCEEEFRRSRFTSSNR